MDNMQMQKPVKKFNIAFLILLVVIAPIWVYTIYLVFKRPDVIHIFWLLMSSTVFILDCFWSQTRFFENRDELNKKIREWSRRRRLAGSQNLPFHEPMPRKQKPLTPVILVVFAICLGIYGFSYLPLKLIDAAVPKTRLIYKGDIRELKEKNYNKYGFLPDEVPKGAKNFKWTVFPSIMQGDGYEVLSFRYDITYIEEEIDTKCAGITPRSAWDLPVSNFLTSQQMQTAEWYPMHDEGDNHRRTWGIVIDRNTEFIAYFVQ